MGPVRQEAALSEIRRRLADVERTGDVGPLFAQETVRNVQILVDYAREHPGGAIDGLAAAGRLYWKRHLVNSDPRRDRNGGGADLLAALCLFTPVYAADRSMVPQALWLRLRELGDAFTGLGLVDLAPSELRSLAQAVISRGDQDVGPVICALDAAMVMLPRDDPDRPALASELAVALHIMYKLDGDRDDLDRAIAIAAEAAEVMAQPVLLSRLGLFYQDRYTLAEDSADLDRSVAMNRAAVNAAGPSDPALAGCLHNLSLSLRALAAATNNPGILDEAVMVARQAVAAGRPDDEMTLNHAASFVSVLVDQFRISGRVSELEEAEEQGRAALAVAAEDNPHLAPMWLFLGLVAEQRYGLDGLDRSRETALEWLRLAIGHAAEGSGVQRAASRSIGELRGR